MDDNVMYAWQVVGDYDNFVHFTCARQETAEYLRDWLQALSEDDGRFCAKACKMTYDPNNGHEQQFSIQECEVIL